jgi:GNAT superfamily N-acetyltransferase
MRLDDGTDLEFRLARRSPEDGEKFRRLYNSLYARKIDLSYYDWQFFQTPFPTTLALAQDAKTGELAGCLGYQTKATRPGGFRAAWAIDVMLAPEYQRRGVFREFAAWAQAQTEKFNPDALCVMANARASPVFEKALGWTPVQTLRSRVCPTALAEGVPISSDLTFAPISGFDRFSPGWAPGDLVWTERSPEYLNWRFGAHPIYSYDAFSVRRRERPAGFLALKTFRDPLTGEMFGDVVDLLWDPSDGEGLLEDMLRFALDFHRREGVAKSLMWLQTNTPLDEAGRNVGFRPIPQDRFFICRPLTEDLSWLADPKRWFITLSDCEIY